MPDAAKDTGFNTPTRPLQHCAAGGCNSDPTMDPVSDLSCLGMPSTDQTTSVAITLTTVVKDFQSQNPVPGAKVIAFDNTSYASPWDMETADQNGNITFNVPAGRKRFGFEMTTTDGTTEPTFLLFQYLDPAMPAQSINRIQSVSVSTAATLPALIGESRTPGTGVLAGTLFDCSKNNIANFIATVSTTQGTATPLTGAESYYFSPGVDLPVRHFDPMSGKGLDSSSADGLFMVIQLPVMTTAYVQMWGFPTAADVTAGNLKLIAELPVPVLADTVITGSYEPLRQ